MRIADLNHYQSNNVARSSAGALRGSGRFDFNGLIEQKDQGVSASGHSGMQGSSGVLGAGAAAALLAAGQVGSRHQTRVSVAGDTLELSETYSARAQVQTANTHSQTVQAALTTAKAAEAALVKPQKILLEMKNLLSELNNQQSQQSQPVNRGEIAQRFNQLLQVLDNTAQTESFAGHKLLDGNFRATFKIGDDQRVTIDTTLPNGKDYSTEGLNLRGVANFVREIQDNKTQMGAVRNAAQALAAQEDLQIALSAVTQVRQGIAQGAAVMVENLTGEKGPFGSTQVFPFPLAQQLTQQASQNVLESSPFAVFCQANSASSSVLRLLS